MLQAINGLLREGEPAFSRDKLSNLFSNQVAKIIKETNRDNTWKQKEGLEVEKGEQWREVGYGKRWLEMKYITDMHEMS